MVRCLERPCVFAHRRGMRGGAVSWNIMFGARLSLRADGLALHLFVNMPAQSQCMWDRLRDMLLRCVRRGLQTPICKSSIRDSMFEFFP